ATTHELYTLPLHDALPILPAGRADRRALYHAARCRHAAEPADGMAAGRRLVRFYDGRALCRGPVAHAVRGPGRDPSARPGGKHRSEEHTSELQSRENLVCR